MRKVDGLSKASKTVSADELKANTQLFYAIVVKVWPLYRHT